jgi:thiol-disulfide isomerase/thioredoxin
MSDETAKAGPPAAAPGGGRRILLVLGSLLVAGAALVLWRHESDPAPRARAPFEISRSDIPAPPFRLPLADGKTVGLGDAGGQVLVVNFWATWCPPCRDEMPSMLRLGRELSQRHPGKFRMLAVSVDEEWGVVRDYFGGPLPPDVTVALDADQQVTRSYYCAARGGCPDSFKFPETYVVDRQGRLVAYMVGPRDWSDPTARQFLEKLIEG